MVSRGRAGRGVPGVCGRRPRLGGLSGTARGGVRRDGFNQLCNVEPIALDHTDPRRGTVNSLWSESAPNKGAHHPRILPAADVLPTVARRVYPFITRPTTAASTPSDTHSNGTAKAGETIGRVAAVGGGSSLLGSLEYLDGM